MNSDAFREGYHAYLDGLDVEYDNPYDSWDALDGNPDQQEKFHDWKNGYYQAMEDD
jgi:hypothetical protein